MGVILRRSHAERGLVPTRLFENEILGHLTTFRETAFHPPFGQLSPEQVSERIREEFDGAYFEEASFHPSEIWRGNKEMPALRHPDPPIARKNEEKIQASLEQSNARGRVERIATLIQRHLRDPKLVADLKDLYDYQCQFCGIFIPNGKPNGKYCEAHHIRPIGAPHHGADSAENILIVCPNHHQMLGFGAIPIDASTLRLNRHSVSDENIAYHNAEIHTGESGI